jgi:hypothetical protein
LPKWHGNSGEVFANQAVTPSQEQAICCRAFFDSIGQKRRFDDARATSGLQPDSGPSPEETARPKGAGDRDKGDPDHITSCLDRRRCRQHEMEAAMRKFFLIAIKASISLVAITTSAGSLFVISWVGLALLGF